MLRPASTDLQPAPFRYPEGAHGAGRLRYLHGLPVLTVEGAAEAVGEAVGALALRPAPRMADYPDDLLRHFWAGWLRGALARAGEALVARFPEAYARELSAVARGAGVDRRKVVIGNTLFDLKKILACSALLLEAGRSDAGGPLFGRNLDYPSMGYAHEYTLVTVYRTPGKRAFASVGFPGLVGVLSGMNDAGLSLGVLEVYQGPPLGTRFDPRGLTYALCFRKILEECATVAEATAMLRGLRRTTLFNLAVADRTRVAALEVTPRQVVEGPPRRGACVRTNHFCADELQPWWQFNVFHTFDRHRTLARLARHTERFDVPQVHAAMHAACQADKTLQTMVFEPAALRLHVAVGRLPSSAGELRTLELAPLLAGKA